jgi:CheY-like chemotaxis protein
MNGEPLHILLVEDNDDHAEIILRSLAEHRVLNTVHRVGDGEAALDFLLRKRDFRRIADSPEPNLVLLDLRLPKVDGLEVLKTIKQSPQLSRIPVVVLTTSEAERDVARAYEYHANSYLVKPLDFARFSELMDMLGYYWLAWNRDPSAQPRGKDLVDPAKNIAP